jgi:hypothetical protein
MKGFLSGLAAKTLMFVMPGLVPGIHVLLTLGT